MLTNLPRGYAAVGANAENTRATHQHQRLRHLNQPRISSFKPHSRHVGCVFLSLSSKNGENPSAGGRAANMKSEVSQAGRCFGSSLRSSMGNESFSIFKDDIVRPASKGQPHIGQNMFQTLQSAPETVRFLVFRRGSIHGGREPGCP